MLVNVDVYRTTLPGVVVATLAVETISSDATVTAEEQAGAVPPDGQLLPTAADVTALDKIPFPVSGLFTVTENVTVAVAPGASVPVQVRFGLAKETLPTVAAAFAVVSRVIQHPRQRVGEAHPRVGGLARVDGGDRVLHDRRRPWCSRYSR